MENPSQTKHWYDLGKGHAGENKGQPRTSKGSDEPSSPSCSPDPDDGEMAILQHARQQALEMGDQHQLVQLEEEISIVKRRKTCLTMESLIRDY